MQSFKTERGAVVVEFALLAPIFLYLVFAIIELSVKAIQQTQLDNFLIHVSQELATSPVTAANKDDYLADLCASGPASLLACEDIILGAQVVPRRFLRWRDRLINGRWNYGCAEDVVIVEMLYPVTHILHSFAVADMVQRGRTDMFRSRGVIRREPLLGSNTLC